MDVRCLPKSRKRKGKRKRNLKNVESLVAKETPGSSEYEVGGSGELAVLPPEVLFAILEWCSGRDVAALTATCTALRDTLAAEYPWRRLCERALQVEHVDLGKLKSYRHLYTKLLHKYAWMVGFHAATLGPYGDLVQVQYKNGLLEGLVWAVNVSDDMDVDEPVTDYTLFTITPLAKGCKTVCLPDTQPHACTLSFTKDKKGFGICCLSPDKHAETVWFILDMDMAYYEHYQDLIRHNRRRAKSIWYPDIDINSTHKKLLCLQRCFDYKMEHRRLRVGRPHDIPAALRGRGGTCPPQLVAPGLFMASYSTHGIEILLFYYDDDNKLNALKVTGDSNVCAGEVSFYALIDFPIQDVDQGADFEALRSLERVPREVPVSDLAAQPFFVPQGCELDYPSQQIPNACFARYHGLGLVADERCRNKSYTDVHVAVVDADTVAVLWLDLESYMECRRIKQLPYG